MSKRRKINWYKAAGIVATQKLGVWYEDWDEAEGEFMGWRKCKDDMPVSQEEFLKFYDKYMKDKKMKKKKTKNEIMPVVGPAKKVFEEGNTKWRKEGNFEGEVLYKEPIPSFPNKDHKDFYIFNDTRPLPVIHTRVVWISRNQGSTMVDVWEQKPKIVESRLKKGDLPYFISSEKDCHGTWIVPSLSVILFGIAPDEGKFIGPIIVNSEFAYPYGYKEKPGKKKNGKKTNKSRN